MLVCHCRGLSDREIRHAIDAGARTLPEVSRHCGAGGECGGCHPEIEDMLGDRFGSRPHAGPLELAATS